MSLPFRHPPFVSHYSSDNNKQPTFLRSRKHAISANIDPLLARAPPLGNYSINYDNLTIRIPNYVFENPTILPGTCASMGLALGRRLVDNLPVVVKLSPYSIRLEREYYVARRLYAQPDGPNYIPKVIELVSLVKDGLTALIYEDQGPCNAIVPSLLGLDPYNTDSTAYRPPTVDEFLEFAIECCSCLHFAHANGVVHAELRPVAFQWRKELQSVKIWNFGAGLKSYEELLLSSWRRAFKDAKVVGCEDQEQQQLLLSKSLENSLSYISPEQTGRTSNVLDHRTDLYSLGVMFFVMLTGRTPFEGSAMDIIHAALSCNVPIIHSIRKDIPPMISLIVDKLTRKAVEERYVSVFGLREDLLECQRRLKDMDTPESSSFFPLGLHDIHSVFQFPQTLFGRDREIELFRTVMKRVSTAHEQNMNLQRLSTSSMGDDREHLLKESTAPSGHLDTNTGCQVVVVTGPAGVGKSSVISTIHAQARKHGFMAISKFDSNQKRPYNGLLRSLSSILRQMLTESEPVIRNFYRNLKEELGPQFSNVRLMLDMVPELKPILSDYDETAEKTDNDVLTSIDNMESRFHAVFLNVIRTIAQKKLITLCLDDLQEADEPSLHLITSLIQSNVTMLIILTSRDGEEMPDMVKHIKDFTGPAQIMHIPLTPLSVDAVNHFISETLHRNSEEIQSLVDVIFQRTRGNPFFIKQLLMMMKRKDEIWLDWREKQWKFRLEGSHTSYPLRGWYFTATEEGTFDVRNLVGHLRELDPNAQVFLMWASLIGNYFTFRQVKWLMMAIDFSGTADDDHSNDQHSDISDAYSINDPIHCIQEDDESLIIPTDYRQPGMDTSGQNISGLSAEEEMRRSNQAITGLQVALQEAIIVSKTANDFHFGHDRYLQAASMLIEEKDRERMHLKIGQMLMLDPEADIFLTADHFIKSLDLIKRFKHRTKYRQVLIKAGTQASCSGALQISKTYYANAMLLLTHSPWEDGPDSSFQETLDLYMKLTYAYWWYNRHTEATRLLEEIMLRTADRPIERAQAWRIQARMYFQQQQNDKGLETIMTALVELGVAGLDPSMIDSIDDTCVVKEYQQLKAQILEVGFDALAKTERCEDRRILVVMSLLNEACSGAYWMRPYLVDAIAVKLIQLSLQYGFGAATGGGFVWLGCTASRLGEYSFGAQLGNFGLNINDQHAGNSEIARSIIIYHVALAQWTGCHYRDYIYQYQRAYKFAIAGGDKLFAAMALFQVASTLYFTGFNLSEIHTHLKKSMDECKQSGSQDVEILNTSLSRCILALQGRTVIERTTLIDDIMDAKDPFQESKFLETIYRRNIHPDNPLHCHWSLKIMLFFQYGYRQEAVDLGFKLFETSIPHPGHRHYGIALYYHSLAMIACLRQDALDRSVKEKYENQLSCNQRILGEWSENSEVNYRMYHMLVEAELSTLENNMARTSRLYNEVIETALEGNWFAFLGLAYELAAEYYIRAKVKMLALPLLLRSIEFYNRWGAWGKSQYLNKRHSDLLGIHATMTQKVETETQTEEHNAITLAGTLGEDDDYLREPPLREMTPDEAAQNLAESENTLFALDIVDLTSIIKSSQVISNEMNSFDDLLKKMMIIIMTNAGAEAGSIVIKDGAFGIAAHSGRLGVCETFETPIPLNDSQGLISTLVVQYVIHTGTMLFIPNIQQDTRFATGKWFEKHGAKSVICLPIMHKNSLVGVLYLQGSLNTFTPKHATVLSLLCDQIGISITNALLFKSVQKATLINARMVESQLEALEEARQSREQALKATQLKSNFLANMSHELRTPFSGFYGMISLLSETQLDAEQREFVMIAKQSCEMLLHIIDDLLDFSKLEARKVKLHHGLVHLDDLLVDRMELLITLASNKNLELAYFIDSAVPCLIYGDGNRIGQILMNLIGNAIKFTHVGEILITISLEDKIPDSDPPLADDEVMLRFSVQDSGIGLTQEETKCLFLPFSQVDGSTTRNFGGTGLGLSICLELVRLMGGTIWVESTENVGSTFHFNIRTRRATQKIDANHATESPEMVIQQLTEQLGPRQLLCVASRYCSMLKNFLPNCTIDCKDSMKQVLQRLDSLSSSDARLYDIVVFETTLGNDIESFLESIDNNASLKALKVLILYTPTVDNIRQQVFHGIHNSRIIRLSKPLRRLKLLNALAEAFKSTEVPLTCPSQSQIKTTTTSPATNEPGRESNSICVKSSRSTTQPSLFTTTELAAFRNRHILVAEDNPVAQKLLVKQLAKLGFLVETCDNGNECVDTWRKRGPGYFMLAWIDHHMPGCDGLEATKRIRSLEREMQVKQSLPIIALTADIQQTAQWNCLQAGMNDYVTKPLMQKDLANVLRRYCL
ncbi:uncharacterized protein BYT42DRAFT_316414 [Radiomyces spectabilis]|uniref:uncharacterized protein n=1 Tax=Radiomyces spectabilis TaxID=64574 RepID=UPI00221E38DE|nr:uncharacterized protein BYT42DRAFT_316414 [Radiomyces spectabilis]KAI8379176.1 hypothetical protein BYT42DRAFT_316414 [Radiomyces spectabilis]